ncbi:MAG TPA: hypothetical protein VGF46_09340, partial [Gaiellales bacterium]
MWSPGSHRTRRSTIASGLGAALCGVLGVLAATQVAEAAHAHRSIGTDPIVRTAHGTFSATRAGTRFRFRWQMSVRGDAGHTISALVSVRYVPQPGTVRAKAPHLQAANAVLLHDGVV